MVVSRKIKKRQVEYNDLPPNGKMFYDFVFSVAKNENEFASRLGLDRADSIYKITKYGGEPGNTTLNRTKKAFPDFNISQFFNTQNEVHVASGAELHIPVMIQEAMLTMARAEEKFVEAHLESVRLFYANFGNTTSAIESVADQIRSVQDAGASSAVDSKEISKKPKGTGSEKGN